MEIVIVVTYRISPCVPHQKTGRALHAPPSFCVICSHLALLCPTSALIRFVRFFLRHFAEFSARSLEWLCSNIVLGSHSNTAHRSTQHAKRRLLSHLRSFRTENHDHRQSSQDTDIIPKLLYPWSCMHCQLSFARHARILVKTCLPTNRC